MELLVKLGLQVERTKTPAPVKGGGAVHGGGVPYRESSLSRFSFAVFIACECSGAGPGGSSLD